MQRELEALLLLQESDLRIADLERELQALLPGLRALEHRRQETAEAVTRAEAAVRVEERRQHDIQRRIAQHTQLQERHKAQLDSIRNVREATAATTQLEVTRRFLSEDEEELRNTDQRIAELTSELERTRGELSNLERDIEAAHAEVAERRSVLEGELESARSERDGRATGISRPLLGKYDRIRGRRAHALYPVRGQACGYCDTAVPLHRRSQMQASGGIEVCEACGVLMYVSGSA